MKLGLDLRGGTRLVLEADVSTSPGVDLDEALNSAVEVVERRVNAFGVAESIIERVGSNRISVQLPGISSEEAVSKIGRTAQLQFMEMAKDPTNGEIIVNQADGTTKTFPAGRSTSQSATVHQATPSTYRSPLSIKTACGASSTAPTSTAATSSSRSEPGRPARRSTSR